VAGLGMADKLTKNIMRAILLIVAGIIAMAGTGCVSVHHDHPDRDKTVIIEHHDEVVPVPVEHHDHD